MTTKRESCVYVFDFTIAESGVDKPTVRYEQVLELCRDLGKKWAFQLEDTEDNRHFQGRISLKEKMRTHQCVERFRRFMDKECYIRITPTMKENKDNVFYVTKEISRIDGPWTSEDVDIVGYIPRQIREIMNADGFCWRPFQESIMGTFAGWDTRSINILIDKRGNVGKTIVKTTCGVYRKAMTIPMVNDYRDILRMVMDMPKVGGYIIDMPRAIKKEKLFQLYSAIESIKDGYAFDDRYNFKYEYFDCPCVWVFCNTEPDTSLMTIDRWNLWEVNDKMELAPYTKVLKVEEVKQEQCGLLKMTVNKDGSTPSFTGI